MSKAAPPVPDSVQDVLRLMGPYVRASLDFANSFPDGDMESADAACTEAFKPLEAALTALVDDNHRLKFELDGVRAMRRPRNIRPQSCRACEGMGQWHDNNGDDDAYCDACNGTGRDIQKTHGIEPEQGESHER